MKNFGKFLGIIAIVAVIGFSMAACNKGGGGGGGNLNGTYSDEYGMATYIFEDGKITMKSMGMSLKGTFQIKGKNIIATFDGLDKPETIKYTLQGDTLTLESDGDTTVLTRKKE
jgi:hypothetical protein